MTGSASRRLGRRKGGVGLIRGGVRSLERRLRDVRGQSTVEAAVMIPLLFGGMLMLLQPGILLYDRVVMEGAAAEGCRVLATASGVFL
ncbi:MAG: TadE/TadG family type IV pilus assembly protein [Eggerthellaceae bacterium]